MHGAIKGLSDFIEKQEKVFKAKITEFVKSQACDYEGMGNLQTIMQKYYKSYTEGEKKLLAKKESLYKSRNVDKWKIDQQIINTIGKEALLKSKTLAIAKMLPKETEEVQIQYIWFVYFASRLSEESGRIHIMKEKAYQKRLMKIYKEENSIPDEVCVS